MVKKKIFKDKIIKQMNDETWTRFTAYSKAEGLITSQLLDKILKNFLKKELSKKIIN